MVPDVSSASPTAPSAGGSSRTAGRGTARGVWTRRSGRYTYLKIKAKIKHLQKLKLNIFLLKIKHFLDENLSNFRKKIVENLQNFEN